MNKNPIIGKEGDDDTEVHQKMIINDIVIFPSLMIGGELLMSFQKGLRTLRKTTQYFFLLVDLAKG